MSRTESRIVVWNISSSCHDFFLCSSSSSVQFHRTQPPRSPFGNLWGIGSQQKPSSLPGPTVFWGAIPLWINTYGNSIACSDTCPLRLIEVTATTSHLRLEKSLDPILRVMFLKLLCAKNTLTSFHTHRIFFGQPQLTLVMACHGDNSKLRTSWGGKPSQSCRSLPDPQGPIAGSTLRQWHMQM
jgi:hypothetical protein